MNKLLHKAINFILKNHDENYAYIWECNTCNIRYHSSTGRKVPDTCKFCKCADFSKIE